MDVLSSAAAGEGASDSTVGSLQREPERLRQEARALQGALEDLYRNHYEVSWCGRLGGSIGGGMADLI